MIEHYDVGVFIMNLRMLIATNSMSAYKLFFILLMVAQSISSLELSPHKKQKVEKVYFYPQVLSADIKKRVIMPYFIRAEKTQAKDLLRNFMGLNPDLELDEHILSDIAQAIGKRITLFGAAFLGKYGKPYFQSHPYYGIGNILHDMCHEQDYDAVSDLLELGIDPNEKNNYANTYCLHMACHKNGDIKITKLLLEKGADPNAQADQSSPTPLFNASAEAIPLLVDYGANINHQDSNGYTPLLQAISYHDDYYRIKTLFLCGADILIKNRFGEDAIRLATAKGRDDILPLFKKNQQAPFSNDVS